MTNQPSLLDALDLITEPTVRVHRDSHTTERSAARKAALRSGSHKVRILFALVEAGERGLTAHELHALTGGAYPHVAATRCLDLGPLVTRTGATRKTPTGDDALVWFATNEGCAAALRLRSAP